jgi:hypothetical protein
METRDLWPENFQEPDSQAPVSILREQARFLGQKTQNKVEGEVHTSSGNHHLGEFQHHFFLVAPPLDHYRYRLFSVYQGIDFYPLHIVVNDGDKMGTELHRQLFRRFGESAPGTFTVQSPGQFYDALELILKSDKTQRLVGSLMAQMAA